MNISGLPFSLNKPFKHNSLPVFCGFSAIFTLLTREHESRIMLGMVFQLTVISKGGCMEEGDPRWVR